MAQQYKIDRVNTLKEEVGKYSGFVFTNYRGLDVQQINELRNDLREKGAEYHVVKNRFMKRVFNDLGYEGFDSFLVDPTALAYFDGDISEIAKVLIETAEETTLELKGGYSDGAVLSPEELERISKLPPRDALIAQTIGLLNAPQRGLVTVLGGVLSSLVRTLKAIETSRN